MDQFPHILNFRDLGGIATADGRVLKTRRLYRGASLCEITAHEAADLVDVCRIRCAIDLRATFERNAQPEPRIVGIESLHEPLVPPKALSITLDNGNLREILNGEFTFDEIDMISMYRKFVDPSVADRWRDIFRALLDSRGNAVLWHCTNGKDRTGVVAAIVLLSLGVPYSTVVDDYLQSNQELMAHRAAIRAEAAAKGEQPGLADQMGPLMKAHPRYLDAMLEEINKEYGGLPAFFEDVCGLSIAEDDQMQSLFLQ